MGDPLNGFPTTNGKARCESRAFSCEFSDKQLECRLDSYSERRNPYILP